MATSPPIKAIETASPNLSAVVKATLVSLLRQTTWFRAHPSAYGNLEAVIDAASGTIKGQQLNAAMKEIDAIGPGEYSIEGDEDALHLKKADERNAYLEFCLTVLYEVPPDSVFGMEKRTSKIIRTPAVIY